MGNGLHRHSGHQVPVRAQQYNWREVVEHRRDHQPRRPNGERRPNGDGNNTAARWNARRQDIVYYFKEKYEEGERTPRVPPAMGYAKFWESPFESQPYVEPRLYPIIWPHGLWQEEGEVEDYSLEGFPRFLTPFLNRDLRLFIKMDGTSNGPRTLEPYPEAQYIFRNFRYLKVNFMHHPLSDGIRVSVEENHGHKLKRQPRFRPMYPKGIIPDHINQILCVSGEDFLLLLHRPKERYGAFHFPEGNGEVPKVVGIYCREMDTNPAICLEWKVALYEWYNQTEEYKLIV